MTAEQALKIMLSYKQYSETEQSQARLKACMALGRNIKLPPRTEGKNGRLVCDTCGSGEYLANSGRFRNSYCGQCGQAIDWTEVTEDGK